MSNKTANLPSLVDCIDFLKNRCRLLESLEVNNEPYNRTSSSKTGYTHIKNSKSFLVSSNKNCSLWKNEHLIYACPDFLKLEASSRLSETKRLKLCINCLRSGHLTKDCRFSGCRKCHKVHNTLLRFQNTKKANTNNISTNDITQPINQSDSEILRSHTVQTIANEVALTTKSAFTKPMVLKSTAMVKISDKYGNLHDYKVLLDS